MKKNLAEINLTEAGQIFAFANTPLFLIRKLQGCQAVSEAKAADKEDLVEALEKALTKEQATLADSVRPFVYLAALATKGDTRLLQKAAELPAAGWDWYHVIAQLIIETYQPVTSESIILLAPQPKPTITFSRISKHRALQ